MNRRRGPQRAQPCAFALHPHCHLTLTHHAGLSTRVMSEQRWGLERPGCLLWVLQGSPSHARQALSEPKAMESISTDPDFKF